MCSWRSYRVYDCQGITDVFPGEAIGVQLPQQLLAITVAKSQCSAESCSELNAPSLQGTASRLETMQCSVNLLELRHTGLSRMTQHLRLYNRA